MGTSVWKTATIDTAGVIIPERKLARACGTAETSELRESIMMMAPDCDSQLPAIHDMQ
jgi:hypothetical protein